MAPVLRKRKAPAPPPEPAPKKPSKTTKVATKAKEAAKEKPAAPKKTEKTNGSSKPAAAAKPVVGDTITLDGFGGEVETNDGTKTTLKALVDESKSGVVLFTYPKASTPGCTNQACLFRDSYEPLTAGGLAIYGLSTDSPKANTTFKQKQNLSYTLLCDPSATLIQAIGLKKTPKGTTRGVFVVDKEGKVLIAEPGGPAATVEAVKKLVEETAGGEEAKEEEEEKPAAEEEEEEEEKEEAKATNGEAAEKKDDDEKKAEEDEAEKEGE